MFGDVIGPNPSIDEDRDVASSGFNERERLSVRRCSCGEAGDTDSIGERGKDSRLRNRLEVAPTQVPGRLRNDIEEKFDVRPSYSRPVAWHLADVSIPQSKITCIDLSEDFTDVLRTCGNGVDSVRRDTNHASVELHKLAARGVFFVPATTL